nr:exodeoxyribonuclease III [Gordonia sp. NB41Y]
MSGHRGRRVRRVLGRGGRRLGARPQRRGAAHATAAGRRAHLGESSASGPRPRRVRRARALHRGRSGRPAAHGGLPVSAEGRPARAPATARIDAGAPDGGARYERKQRFLDAFTREVNRNRLAAARAGREFLLVGDLNVAHTRHDVTNWRPAQKMDGFLPEDREWFDTVLGSRRLVDVVRQTHGERPGPLTWWSWAGQSFTKDVGWRVDHQLATPGLARLAVDVTVDKEAAPDERLSDHAPLVVTYRELLPQTLT